MNLLGLSVIPKPSINISQEGAAVVTPPHLVTVLDSNPPTSLKNSRLEFQPEEAVLP